MLELTDPQSGKTIMVSPSHIVIMEEFNGVTWITTTASIDGSSRVVIVKESLGHIGLAIDAALR